MQGKLIRIGVTGAYLVTPLTETPDLKTLQDLVGGYIEMIPRFDTFVYEGVVQKCVALCNEDGRSLGLPENPVAYDLWLEALDRHGLGGPPRIFMGEPNYLVGDVAVIVGDDELLESL